MAQCSEVEAIPNMVNKECNHFVDCTATGGPFPLDYEDVEHYGTTQKYRCWQKGPGSIVYHDLPEMWGNAAQFADREFLVLDDLRMTFGEVLWQAKNLAVELIANHGAQKGDIIAIAGRNTPQWVISFIAVSGWIGGVVLPVNSMQRDEDLMYVLEHSETKLLIVDGERLRKTDFREKGFQVVCMNQEKEEVAEVSMLQGYPLWEDIMNQGSRRNNERPLEHPKVDQDEPAMLMYTSGTTSKPKGVVMTHRVVMSAVNMLRLMSYDPDTKGFPEQIIQLVPVPLFHVNGTHNMLLTGGCMGKKLVMMKKWDSAEALRLIEREEIQVVMGVPTMTYEILNHPDFDKFNTDSIRTIGGGGAPFAAPMVKEVKERFKNALAGTGYGLTETSSTVSMFGGNMFCAVPSSVGRLAYNIDACVLDSGNNKLVTGGVGELCIHGPIIMSEYLKSPQKTKEAFHMDEDGKLWFRTGDIGRIDPGNFVFIMDRAKDMIIRGGENISCSEVENCIFNHPSVAEVAAFGLPDERLGETVSVAVVFKRGAESASLDGGWPNAVLMEDFGGQIDLRGFCQGKLAKFKIPTRIFRWPGVTFPKGATGKVLKKKIKETTIEFLKRRSPSFPYDQFGVKDGAELIIPKSRL